MPWLSANFASAGLAILKSALKKRGVDADVHYLNLLLAERLGLPVYQFIAGYVGDNLTGLTLGEWLFSRHLFGSKGTGELDNDLPAMRGVADFQRSLARLQADCRLSRQDFQRIMDRDIPEFLADCRTRVPWERYDIIGFSSVFWNHVSSLTLAKALKAAFPDKAIVFGGANVSAEMGHETLRAFPWIDYVVDGEGEEALSQLAVNLAGGRPHEPIPGVSFRKQGSLTIAQRPADRPSLDTAPPPDYDEYIEGLRATGLSKEIEPVLFFEGSRGCWFGEKSHCTFCGFNWKTMQFRSKSPRRLVREILSLNRRYHAHHLYCTDNILDMRYFDTFLPMMRREIRRRGLDLRLFYEVKSNLTPEQIQLLAEGGVREIQAGIESLNSDVLRLMRKGVTGIQNVQTLKFSRRHRVKIFWNILYGFPGEEAAQYREMLEALPSLTHLLPPYSLTRLYLERFSPYHSDPKRFGLSELQPKPLYRHVYPEGRVDLGAIAYYFNAQYPAGQQDAAGYMEPIERFVERWRRFAPQLFCFQVRSEDCVDIHDYRLPDPTAEAPRYRKHRLTGTQAALYSFCESQRSLEAIRAFAAGRPGQKVAADQVQRVLDDWVGRRLMYREGERYLSLALPLDCYHDGILDRAHALETLDILPIDPLALPAHRRRPAATPV